MRRREFVKITGAGGAALAFKPMVFPSASVTAVELLI